MKNLISVIIVVIVIGFLAYIVFYDRSDLSKLGQDNNTNTSLVYGTSTDSNPEGVNVFIGIDESSFTPNKLSVKKGTKITWVNNDREDHSISFDSNSFPDSPTLKEGDSYSYTFATPANVTYHCGIHPDIKGEIEITEEEIFLDK